MDNQWKDLKIIKDFFQVGEDGQMPEGSRMLLEAMERKEFGQGQDIVTDLRHLHGSCSTSYSLSR